MAPVRTLIALAVATLTLAACDASAPAPSPSTTATDSPAVTPSATVTSVVRLASPTPGHVTITATGTPGTAEVTSEGDPIGTVNLEEQGAHLVGEIETPLYGAQTVCVADHCARVLVGDPADQTVEEATAIAEQALTDVLDATGAADAFPGWTFEVRGPQSGAGGSSNPATSTLVVHATPGRTYDDYIVTALHELGHVVDMEWMDEARRDSYRDMRGMGEDTAWVRGAGEHPLADERWHYGAEDFAEVIATWLTMGEHTPRTGSLVPAPTATDIDALIDMIPELEALHRGPIPHDA